MKLFNLFAKTPSATYTPNYKEYVAYIFQSGVNSPIPSVYLNDLGAELTFSRNGVGEYMITSTGLFSNYKRIIPIFNPQQGSPIMTNIFWNDVNSLGVYTWDKDGIQIDNVFIGNLIIRIYN
jgi:hypothetical protein